MLRSNGQAGTRKRKQSMTMAKVKKNIMKNEYHEFICSETFFRGIKK